MWDIGFQLIVTLASLTWGTTIYIALSSSVGHGVTVRLPSNPGIGSPRKRPSRPRAQTSFNLAIYEREPQP